MAYTPDRGDIILLSFDPTLGREQKGMRPAVVISPKLYNGAARLALVCPITRQRKGYPFEVEIVSDQGVDGAVLVDQLRSIDWKERKARRVGVLTADQLQELLAKVATLVG
jgi:mRNA interferase MazF